MKCIAATVAFRSTEQWTVAPNVLALDIPAAPDEPVTMELRFTVEIDKAATRPFMPPADFTGCGFAAKVQ